MSLDHSLHGPYGESANKQAFIRGPGQRDQSITYTNTKSEQTLLQTHFRN